MCYPIGMAIAITSNSFTILFEKLKMEEKIKCISNLVRKNTEIKV